VRNFFLQLYNQVRDIIQRLSTQQKIIIGFSSLIIVAGLIILLVLTSRPIFTPLFSNLSSEDASAVVNKLKELKVDYRLATGGSTVLVPKPVVYETRLSLAGVGLPQEGGVGFEVFDKTSYNLTDFTQRINYLRALQGELSRTIGGLSEVERCRVHLVIPKPELYIEEEKEATACVVLKLKPAAFLKEEQIKGIMHLVSHSVEGLKLKNVDVIDIHGNLLSEVIEPEKTPFQLTATQVEFQKNYERDTQRGIQSMLEKVLGPNKAVVRVSAEFDFSKSEVKSETYQPVVGEEGIVRSEQEMEESYKGEGGAPEGVPGVSSNVPGYPSATPATGEYKRRESTLNYELSKTIEHKQSAPGTLKKLSVGLFVDSKGLSRKKVNDIKEVASAACGLDLKRGDKIEVQSIPFSTELLEKEEAAMAKAAQREFLQQVLMVSAGVVFLVVLLLLALKMKKVREEEIVAKEAVPVKELEGVPPEGAPPLEALPPEEVDKERQRRRQILAQVGRLFEEKPEETTQMLKSWLVEK